MHPQPLFSIFGFNVYLYGICMAVGIVCCFLFLYIAMRKLGFNEEARDKILVIGFFGTAFGIFSATLFQSLYNYIADPSGGFHLGGMTFIGGLIGGVASFLGVWNLYVYVIAPRAKSKLLQNHMNAGLSDALTIIPIGILIAHGFGRLGCFFGGCCYGHVTDAWYGMYCAGSYDPVSGLYFRGDKVVPTQLFEMLFLFALAAALAFLFFRYKFKYNFAAYAIAYGIWRFCIEFVRGDPRGQFLGTALYPSQFWSIIMVILGVGYIFLQKYVLAKKMKLPWIVSESAVAAAAAGEGSVEVVGGTAVEAANEAADTITAAPLPDEATQKTDGATHAEPQSQIDGTTPNKPESTPDGTTPNEPEPTPDAITPNEPAPEPRDGKEQ